MPKTYSDAMPTDATAADWATRPKAEIITAMLLLQANMGGQINTLTAMRAENAGLTESLENANMMLAARSTELERSQKIAAEMSATVAKQRDEIRECNADINAGRKSIDELKKALRDTELQAAGLRGQLERVAVADKHRMTLGGVLSENHGRAKAYTSMSDRAQRDAAWVTF